MTTIRSSLAALLAVFTGAGLSGAAFATTFNVNSTFDVVAAAPLNNGVCETAPGNGVCTLRAAIMKANHFPGGGVTINVPANALPYKLTIVPAGANDETTGDLNITATMTIMGAGAATTIIDGNATDRVFNISTGGAVTITGVTIRNGATAGPGGGIYIDSGTLTFNNSAITGSSASNGGGILLASGSSVTLSGVTLSGNTTSGSGGGLFSANSGSATINDSTISNNTADVFGGGLKLGAAANIVNRSTVAGNRAAIDGGGIYFGGPGGPSALIANSVINANHSGGNGGGIHSDNSLVSIQNSTVSANGAVSNGGGISQSGVASGAMRLFHVTVAGNLANSDRTTSGIGGGIYRAAGSNANEVWNSIVVENSVGVLPRECAGDPTTSQDYNMFQTLTGCTLNGTTTHNISSVIDPLLDGLQDNGGATFTRALFASSPAIDQIPSASCRDSVGVAPNPDQRGVVRPVGPQCDMGAYEGNEPASLVGRNLIRNGDAENGAGSIAGAFIRVPNWTVVQGEFTVVPYGSPGGFPLLTDAVPANHGYNFFAGGSDNPSIARQTITVVALATAIDAGQVTFNMAGDFGGYANQDDQAALSVVFRDIASNQVGGNKEIGHVLASDRGDQTGFLHRSLSGSVPAGTRQIEVTAFMFRGGTAGYNDGYEDNLSLVLSGGSAPPILQNVVSRKTHGGAGTFNLPLGSVVTNPTTEPRIGPTQTIVFTFDKPINAAAATIIEGTATAGAPTFSGNDVIVGLTGVTNQQYVTVSLTNVASSDGGTGGSGSVRIGFLVGDVNQNRVVTVSDLSLVNAQLAQPVTAANYLKDVNATGTLTVSDKSITNTNLSKALPAP